MTRKLCLPSDALSREPVRSLTGPEFRDFCFLILAAIEFGDIHGLSPSRMPTLHFEIGIVRTRFRARLQRWQDLGLVAPDPDGGLRINPPAGWGVA